MLCLAAYAKINWTLDILGTRPDGYHLMDMLMQTVSLCDLLWMEEAEDLTLEAVPGGTERAARSKTNDGLSSAGVRYDESNLVYRAALLLRERFGVRRGARIQLEKRIPSGAGMGGGSADCAAALKGLNALWGLGLSRAELQSLGLELGADDYIVKPFETKEVTARIKAVLRRCGSKDEENKGVYDFDNLHLDMNRYELKVKGKVVDAPPKELELLACLAGHPNRVYTRDQLLDEVWGFEYYGDSRTIDVHVKRLREKLEGASEQWNLKTVWGVGYKFEVKE